jgi:hypothetical protein
VEVMSHMRAGRAKVFMCLVLWSGGGCFPVQQPTYRQMQVCLADDGDFKVAIDLIRSIADRYDLDFYDSSAEIENSYSQHEKRLGPPFFSRPVVNTAFRGGARVKILATSAPLSERTLIVNYVYDGSDTSPHPAEVQVAQSLSERWRASRPGEQVGHTCP